MFELFPQRKVPLSVIDYGCCTGGNTAALAKDFSCTGVDASPTALEFAAEKYPDVSFLLAKDPSDISTTLSQADVILLADVIEHIEDDVGFLESMRNLVKCDTSIMITVPADPRLWSLHDDSHGHFRRYTRETLIQLLENCQLEVQFCSYFNTRLYGLVRFLRWKNSRKGTADGEHSTDLWLPPKWINRTIEEIFAGEKTALVKAVRRGKQKCFRQGVSLVAICRVSKS
jgi:SAM-dependent methyltransferase